MFRIRFADFTLADTGAQRRVISPTDLLRMAVTWAAHVLCGLHGHIMVRHFEPRRLSLQCLACGAQTRGWALDARPPGRCIERSRPRRRAA